MKTVDDIKNKIIYLINKTRVMTLAVSWNNIIPWSSPVYFVFHDKKFYFLSNKNTKHIKQAGHTEMISASIFHDSDHMDLIFGFQMSGKLEIVSESELYLIVIKKYLKKFSFLRQIFGDGIIENKKFFLEKFKSRLYCFHPNFIIMSDNSGKTKKELNAEDLP